MLPLADDDVVFVVGGRRSGRVQRLDPGAAAGLRGPAPAGGGGRVGRDARGGRPALRARTAHPARRHHQLQPNGSLSFTGPVTTPSFPSVQEEPTLILMIPSVRVPLFGQRLEMYFIHNGELILSSFHQFSPSFTRLYRVLPSFT